MFQLNAIQPIHNYNFLGMRNRDIFIINECGNDIKYRFLFGELQYKKENKWLKCKSTSIINKLINKEYTATKITNSQDEDYEYLNAILTLNRTNELWLLQNEIGIYACVSQPQFTDGRWIGKGVKIKNDICIDWNRDLLYHYKPNNFTTTYHTSYSCSSAKRNIFGLEFGKEFTIVNDIQNNIYRFWHSELEIKKRNGDWHRVSSNNITSSLLNKSVVLQPLLSDSEIEDLKAISIFYNADIFWITRDSAIHRGELKIFCSEKPTLSNLGSFGRWEGRGENLPHYMFPSIDERNAEPYYFNANEVKR